MKKELSMEMRLLIAFVLMGLVLFVSQYYLKPPAAANATKAGQSKPAQTASTQAAQAPEQPVPAADSSTVKSTKAQPDKASSAAVQGAKEETFTVDTDVSRVEFSSKGAVVRSWILKAYKDHDGHPLELVNRQALAKLPAPFSLAFKGTAPGTDPNTALFKTDRSDDGLAVSFEFSDGHATTKKSFRFAKSSYLVSISTEVTQNGVLVPHMITWRGGFGDASVVNPATVQQALYYDLPNTSLKKKTAKDAKDGPVSASGQFSFVGLEDSYFAAAFLPRAKTSVEQVTLADNLPDSAGKDQLRVGMSVGGEGSNDFALFVGPKDSDLLAKVDPKLSQIIDWGWWWFIAKPLFYAVNWTADRLAHNYGWAIILVTVVINMALFPLRLTSMKSSKKMQSLQPQINAINDKYKSIPLRDPRQSEKNQEIMDLYKKNDVNPVGGCLPMVLQMPFLLAFYKVLAVSIDLRGAHWLWVSDLSQPETLAIHTLPVLLIITQFLTQKMTPTPGMDPTQQKMMMVMPLIFGYMFYYASAGLALYWLTGGVVGVAQQLLLNKIMPTPKPVAPPPKKKK